jgi:ribosomal protein S18 acetylase RimI-like enzyme
MDTETSRLGYVELTKDMISRQVVRDINALLPQLSSNAPTEGIQADWLEQVFKAGTRVFAVFDGETLIGTVLLCRVLILMGKKFWIEDVVVDKQYRRRGIAEELMKMAIRASKDEGGKKLDLTSKVARKAAHRLYFNLGFGERDETVVFRLDLESVNL